MSSTALNHFTCLDELFQVIYQGVNRFVCISKVNDQNFTIFLGLVDDEGRWFRGDWLEKDILKIVGTKASAQLLEAFASKLAETLVQGDCSITNFGDADSMKFTFGSKNSIHMPLAELTSQDAAVAAAAMFFEIALQAQPRNCRIIPTSSPAHHEPSGKSIIATPELSHPLAKVTAHLEVDRVDQVLAEKAPVKAKHKPPTVSAAKGDAHAPGPSTNTKTATGSRSIRGSSLANPAKKARKYQAIEFESDDE